MDVQPTIRFRVPCIDLNLHTTTQDLDVALCRPIVSVDHAEIEAIEQRISCVVAWRLPVVSIQLKGTLARGPVDPLAFVPKGMRTVVKAYLQSRMPQDEQRGRELATQYGLDYDGIRRRWNVYPKI